MIFLLPFVALAVLFAAIYRKMTLEQLADLIAAENGVEPALLKAVVKLESAWKVSAENQTGGDLARGGAYGLGQVTLKTAQAFEPSITPSQLLQPDTNLRLASKVLAEGMQKFGNADDAFAYYNSGKPFALAPESTQTRYVPLAKKYYLQYRS